LPPLSVDLAATRPTLTSSSTSSPLNRERPSLALEPPANVLGLTTQVPVKIVYWTSGRTRSYKLGKLTVYLQHVPDWQLVLWDEPPGELVRALAWAGPAEASKVLSQIADKVPEAAIRELQQNASRFPPWLHNALQQIGQPRTPSSRGEWDVSDFERQRNQPKRKAK
jgi:Family of unknown function (DUF6088)